jgi:hypothetical protein
MFLKRITLSSILLTSAGLISACAHSTGPQASRPATYAEPTPATAAPVFRPLLAQNTPSPPASATVEPPKPAEIKNVVSRVFEKAADPELSRDPSFVTGDFNGDGSEDLAVFVKPGAESLAEINNELANWVLEDPHYNAIQDAKTVRPAVLKPARVEKNETLLAIIHGVGAEGWRNPDARQTFLLKNAVAGKMTFESFRTLRERRAKQKLPDLRGDAIGETIGGTSGLLYWNGAKYSWYATSR